MRLTVLLAATAAAIQQPKVDLGYGVYEGVVDHSLGVNKFKGIRFAAPPIGSLRWQAPQLPAVNRTSIIPANAFGPACPQTPRSGIGPRPVPSPIDEDCLFLNVYAPQNATKLPVLVWIHGGGYGVGDGREELSRLIAANDNGFVGVSIQYRLGAFGFLAGDEVFRNGVVNAGLLDQKFALQWVQQHIHQFGGDPRIVTIWGVSAGAGSVMLHNIANRGSSGTSLFTNSISSSPYLPQQYGYADWIPSQSYYAFASRAGCFTASSYGNGPKSIFQCLISQNTTTLQEASSSVSKSGRHGTWAFLPVTDGVYIQSAPSTALTSGHLNGLTHLTSNAAEESFPYVPQNITTSSDLKSWISLAFPLLTPTDIQTLLSHYPSSPSPLPKAPTRGTSLPSALDTSALATSYQQTAVLIYSESTFICSSHWLAEAYTLHRNGGYKFQSSTPVALHGIDDTAVFGNKPLPIYSRAYISRVQRLWGTFITTGNVSGVAAEIGLAGWEPYSRATPAMANFNQTGGVREKLNGTLVSALEGVDVEWAVGPGLENAFSVVSGFEWEAGRGERCEFWRGVGARVPM